MFGRRKKHRTTSTLLRSKATGRHWVASHGGFGEMVRGLFGSGPQFWFIRARRYRGKWIASPRLVWKPKSGEFEILQDDVPILLTAALPE